MKLGGSSIERLDPACLVCDNIGDDVGDGDIWWTVCDEGDSVVDEGEIWAVSVIVELLVAGTVWYCSGRWTFAIWYTGFCKPSPQAIKVWKQAENTLYFGYICNISN